MICLYKSGKDNFYVVNRDRHIKRWRAEFVLI